MDIFNKRYSSIEPLDSYDIGMVFGGESNVCICYYTNPHSFRISVRGYGDDIVDSEDVCRTVCCGSRFPASYTYRDEDRKYCPFDGNIVTNVNSSIIVRNKYRLNILRSTSGGAAS